MERTLSFIITAVEERLRAIVGIENPTEIQHATTDKPLSKVFKRYISKPEQSYWQFVRDIDALPELYDGIGNVIFD